MELGTLKKTKQSDTSIQKDNKLHSIEEETNLLLNLLRQTLLDRLGDLAVANGVAVFALVGAAGVVQRVRDRLLGVLGHLLLD